MKHQPEPEIYPTLVQDRTPFEDRPSYCNLDCSVCGKTTTHKREGDVADFFCTEPHGMPKWMGNKVDMREPHPSINDEVGATEPPAVLKLRELAESGPVVPKPLAERDANWCGVPAPPRKSLKERMKERHPRGGPLGCEPDPVQRTPGPVPAYSEGYREGYRDGLKAGLRTAIRELLHRLHG